ncbi:YhgE/Pip domain-containing protein [Clostridium thermopalmarium]|uniref:Chromosome segregation protein n=1 Tax=Clostridium thermopalmarium DSM 5974 TaxID=1121340 RepID=A0A2T0ATI1_9CLOT|nr:YhgE/Pip domain-containing protein [Clostridium thermopalmarium]PRR73706.1 chromosome segregation protein [Clostridium thermopalmarium DSM 5974]PVZ21020.1 putative membrane protein [Clostridium thermopalmarium DSM 5974]
MKVNVKTIAKMYKKDLNKIITSWATLIIIIGLAVLPSLYAWVNIYASWDPYSNTSGIKVGIVNNDAGGSIRGIEFNIGNEVVKLLKENKKLGWTFYKDADEGIKKVEEGEVYATIIIPSEFSLEMSTLLDKNPVKPTLEYYVNQKINAIAPKMTDSGASTLQKEISKSFIETVTKKVFEILNKAGVKIDENYDKIEKYKGTLYTINDNYPKINKALDDLIKKSDGTFVNINKTSDNITFIQDTLKKTIQLNEDLSKSLTDKSDEVEDISGDIDNIKENLAIMENTFSKISTTTDDLNNKISIYKPDMLSDIDDAIDEANRLSNEMKEVSQDLADLGEDVPKDLKEESDKIVADIEVYRNLLNTLDDSLSSISDNTIDLLDSLVDLNESISDKFEDINKKIDKTLKPIDNLLKRETFSTIRNKLEDAEDDFNYISRKTKRIRNTLKYTSSEVGKSIDSINAQIDDLKDLVQRSSKEIGDTTSEKASKLSSDFERISGNLDKLQGRLNTLKNNLNNNKNIEELLPEISKLTLNISNDLSKLQDNINSSDIVSQVQEALQKGSEGVLDLNTMIKNMKDDMNFLKDFLSDISSKGKIAVKDIKNFQKRNKDIEKKINDITSKVKAFDNKISLKDLANLLKTDGDTEGDFLALPVNLKTHNLFPVENYGAGLTPFYTTLSLWVGALLLCALLSVKFHNGSFEFNPREEYFAKYLLFVSIAILQGFIVSVGDILVLGIKVQFPVLFVALAVYQSIIFNTIVYTLVSLFDNVGKAIGIIFLVLQLAGSGGTFPIQVTPNFFQKIHYALPFTYGISAMREALAGVTYSTLSKDVITLSLFFLIFLALGYILKPRTTKLCSKLTHKLNDSGVIGH